MPGPDFADGGALPAEGGQEFLDRMRLEGHDRVHSAHLARAMGRTGAPLPEALQDLMAMAGRARKAQEAINALGAGPRAVEPHPDPTQPSLVAVGGWMTAGKDEFADALVRLEGYAKAFMSEPLNNAVVALHRDGGPWVRLDFPVDAVYPDGTLWKGKKGDFIRYGQLLKAVGYQATKEHADARAYLQGLGTEVGRKMFGENVWTEVARKKIRELRAEGQPVVITGVRYPNELAMVLEEGGTSIWVHRPGVTAPKNSHSSETSLGPEDFYHEVHNDGDLDLLANRAQGFAEYLRIDRSLS